MRVKNWITGIALTYGATVTLSWYINEVFEDLDRRERLYG